MRSHPFDFSILRKIIFVSFSEQVRKTWRYNREKSKTIEFNTARHDIFKHMLKTIFTRADLKYEYIKAKKVWEVRIGDGSDLVSDCKKSYSPEYKRQFKELFGICLLESGVEYHCYHNKKEVAFSKDDVIKNILDYLSSLGIILTNPFKVDSEKKLFAKLLYKYIAELLDVVFDIKEGEGILNAADHNISAAFEKKIGQLGKRTAITDITTLIYSVACKNDLEVIIDPDYDKGECNYALCISTRDRMLDVNNNVRMTTEIIFIDSVPAERWYTLDGFFEKRENVSFTFLDWNTEDSVKEFRNQPWRIMIKGFEEYPFSKNQQFKSRKLRNDVQYFELIDYDEYGHQLPRYFYFVTKLSEEELNNKYSSFFDNPSLLSHLENKGVFQLKKVHSFDEKKYLRQLLENIVNPLSMLLKVDTGTFFDTELKLKSYISNLPDFIRNHNSLFQFLKKHKANEKQTIIVFIYTVSVLIDSLCNYFENLTISEGVPTSEPYTYNFRYRCIMMIKNNLSEDVIKSYADRIKVFLDSGKLTELIEAYRTYYDVRKDCLSDLDRIIDSSRSRSILSLTSNSIDEDNKGFYPFEYLRSSLEVIYELLTR